MVKEFLMSRDRKDQRPGQVTPNSQSEFNGQRPCSFSPRYPAQGLRRSIRRQSFRRDAEFAYAPGFQTEDRTSAVSNHSRARLDGAAQDADQGGFAGTVWADQPDDFTICNAEGDLMQGNQLPIALGEL